MRPCIFFRLLRLVSRMPHPLRRRGCRTVVRLWARVRVAGIIGPCVSDDAICSIFMPYHMILIALRWQRLIHTHTRPTGGGKFSNWEGGIRAVALVAGGFLPPERRGQQVCMRGTTAYAQATR